jgi:uncharacterized 2Fe-2S/4Fe-4S cluster protein (DUF4445 family)
MCSNHTDIIVDFEPISRRAFIFPNKNFYEILIKSGINIRSLCGGLGSCGKCKIIFQKGQSFLTPPTQMELTTFSKEELKEGWRLACQTRVRNEDMSILKEKMPPHFRVFLPEDVIFEDFKILTSGINKGVHLKPNITKYVLQVEKARLNKPLSDLDRVKVALKNALNGLDSKSPVSIEYNVLKELSRVLREKDHEITVTLLNRRSIIDCESGDKADQNFGIAIDIGTTTIVAYLINLNNGKTYAVASCLNPQTAFGEDVVSRITFVSTDPNGLAQLNSTLIAALNTLIMNVCKKAKIDASHIYEATIVGNSVMHHLFLNINPRYIGLSPYIPAIQQSINVRADRLKLGISRQGNIFVLPLIAGYVGADTIGLMLSSEIYNEDKFTLAIDVGTNGELVIGNKNILATGSCAAGSALEGAHITHGMRAAAGAIDRITIDPQSLDISYTTINNKSPIGICGSGLIDCVAELLKANIISRSGNFNKSLLNKHNFIKTQKGIEFIITDPSNTQINHPITISQKDIREIQMAKGAFFSGMRMIMQYLRREHNYKGTISQIFLAGAFGSYINKENAKFIGMIPDISTDSIYQIGNAAGIGAQNALLDTDLREKAQELLQYTHYVEIAVEENFQKEFAQAMYFPHMNLDLFPSLEEYKQKPNRY